MELTATSLLLRYYSGHYSCWWWNYILY